MRKFVGIIESPIAPPTNCLWVKNNTLMGFIGGTWKNLSTTIGNSSDNNDILIIDLSGEQTASLYSLDQVIIENNQITEGVDTIIVRTEDSVYYLMDKTLVFNNSIVYLGFLPNLHSFNTPSMQGMYQIIGVVNAGNNITLGVVPTSITNEIIGLSIGNSDAIAAKNLKILTDANSLFFFTQLDYGYGVGTFTTTGGGFVHITNAYGNDVFYNISKNGSITVDNTYIKPNEPYSVILEANQIGITLPDIVANKVYKCGELIVRGSTGDITYTRCSDSTSTSISFTNITKNGKISVLTYNNSTKTINSSTIYTSIPEASVSSYGAVKQAAHVAKLNSSNATVTDCAVLFNSLRDALIAAGIMN